MGNCLPNTDLLPAKMGSPSNLTTNASQLVNAVRGTYPGGKGRLVALPTKIELQLSCQTIEVFVATVPLKSANTIFKYVHLEFL